jgi:hypothetical protein
VRGGVQKQLITAKIPPGDSSHSRRVLFVDFRKSPYSPANFINRLLPHLVVFTPFIHEGVDNQEAWKRHPTRKPGFGGIDKASWRAYGLLFGAITISSLPECVIPI